MNRTDDWNRQIGDRVRRIEFGDRFRGLAGEDLAREHCAGRNETILYALAYLERLRKRGAFGATATLTVEAASSQTELPARTPLPIPPEVRPLLQPLSPTQRAYIEQKCYQTEDAHRAPCQLLVNGRRLQDYLQGADELRHAHAVTLFQAVDRMPKIVNETDSTAENNRRRGGELQAGLCQAFRAAGQRLLAHGGDPGRFDVAAVRQAYAKFVAAAVSATQACLLRNEQRLDLEQSRGGPLEKRFYYLAKDSFLRLYLRFTESEAPPHLRNPSLLEMVA